MEVRILMVKDVLSSPATGIRERGVRAAKVKEGEATVRRRKALRRLDRELEKGNCKAALSLMKQFKAYPGGLLRGFGAAALAKVPRSVSSSLQFLIDAILHSIRHSPEKDKETQHEAGHFLVGYMLGVLTRRYKVPSVDDLLKDKSARGKVEFVGFEFLRDVSVDVLSNRNFRNGKLNKENIYYWDTQDLLHSDVQKLDRVLNWLGFTQDEVDFEPMNAAKDKS